MREIEHRRAAVPLDEQERGQEHARGTKAPITIGWLQPLRLPLEIAKTRAVSPTTKVAVPVRSSPRSSLCPDISCSTSQAHAEPISAERDVEPEDPGPADRDERAAEHRADDEPDRRDHDVRPHREAELPAAGTRR